MDDRAPRRRPRQRRAARRLEAVFLGSLGGPHRRSPGFARREVPRGRARDGLTPDRDGARPARRRRDPPSATDPVPDQDDVSCIISGYERVGTELRAESFVVDDAPLRMGARGALRVRRELRVRLGVVDRRALQHVGRRRHRRVLSSPRAWRRAGAVLLLEAGPDYGRLAEGRWPPEILDARGVVPTTYGSREPRTAARWVDGCSEKLLPSTRAWSSRARPPSHETVGRGVVVREPRSLPRARAQRVPHGAGEHRIIRPFHCALRRGRAPTASGSFGHG